MVTHDFPNLAPSVCFVCEGAEPGAVFVDTFRKFDPGFNTYLNGRKYVCSNCIRDLAHHVGIFDEERERFQIQANEASEQIVELTKTVSDYQRLDAAIKAVGEQYRVPTPAAPKAAPKKAVKPATKEV